MATDHNFRIKNGLEVGGQLIVTSSGALVVSSVQSNLSFNDNIKAKFGNGSDLQIYHDGSNSYIDEAGTGELRLRSNEVELRDMSNEVLARFSSGGSSVLFYDNAEKFKTHSLGAEVEGQLWINDSNTHIKEGSSNSLRVQTPSGYIDVGPHNTSYAHMGTDRPQFYFNKKIVIGEDILTSYDADLQLQRVNSTKITLTSTGANVTGDLAVSGDLNITGDINSVSVTDLDIVDKTITVGQGQSASNSTGSGLKIAGANVEFIWDNTNAQMTLNKDLKFTASEKLRFGNTYFHKSGDSNNVHFYATGGLIPHHTTTSNNATLGASSYRWNGVYSSTGDFSGTITINQGDSFSKLDIKTSRTGAASNIGGVQFYNSSNAQKSQLYGTNDGQLKLATNGTTVALTLDASQNATFAGTISNIDSSFINVNNPSSGAAASSTLRLQAKGNQAGTVRSSHWYLKTEADSAYGNSALVIEKAYDGSSAVQYFKINSSGDATFAGSITATSNANQLILKRTDDAGDDWRFYSWTDGLNIFPSDEASTVWFGRDGSTTDVSIYNGNLKIGADTVIDSSRNLTNIGTISSGAITSTGNISTSGVLQVNVGTASHQRFRITRANSTTAALYMGVDSSNNAMIASNNSGLRIGKDVSGTFYEYLTVESGGNTNVKNALEINNTTVIDASRNLTINEDLNFSTNGFADISNTGTGAIRFKPSSQTLALTLTGANATFAGTISSPTIHNTGVIYLGSTATANDQFAVNTGTDIFIGTSAKGLRTYKDLHTNSGNNKYWHAGNDGSGSGLDADLLDGQHGSYYARKVYWPDVTTRLGLTVHSLTNLNTQALWSQPAGYQTMIRASQSNGLPTSHGQSYFGYTITSRRDGGGGYSALLTSYDNSNMYFTYQQNNTAYPTWRKIWHDSNDGSGSGLDADLLDGQHGSYYAAASSIPTVGNGTIYINTAGSVSGGGNFTVNQSGNSTLTITGNGIMQGTHAVGNGSFSNTSPTGGFRFQRITGGSDRFTTNHHNLLQIPNTSGNDYLAQIAFETGSSGLGWRSKGTSWTDWYEIWHAGNDGSGSGLDADLLDGQQGSYYYSSANPPPTYSKYLRSDTSDSVAAGVTYTWAATDTTGIILPRASGSQEAIHLGGWSTANSTGISRIRTSSNLHIDSPSNGAIYLNNYNPSKSVYMQGGNKAWHAGNDGSGSGLDADMVDSLHASQFVRSDANDTKSGNLVLQTSGASTDTTTGLHFESGGSYTDGRYRTRFRKQDVGGGIPLYIDQSGSTANSYTAQARFGTYSGNNYEFEVYGDMRATGDIAVVGGLTAATKSFDIKHPTKDGMRLHHGVLEGPEHAVYIRGKTKDSTIQLPEYWIGLVHEDTITVQLTSIGKSDYLYVDSIGDNVVNISNDTEYFYFIQAERKDIERFEVEYGDSL